MFTILFRTQIDNGKGRSLFRQQRNIAKLHPLIGPDCEFEFLDCGQIQFFEPRLGLRQFVSRVAAGIRLVDRSISIHSRDSHRPIGQGAM